MTRMKVTHTISETTPSFLQHLRELVFIEAKPLKFCSERLTSLVRTLELMNIEDYQPLQEVAMFATLVSTYDRGFLLILEPYESEAATVPNPVLHLACLDAAIAFRPVVERFSSIVVTSGKLWAPSFHLCKINQIIRNFDSSRYVSKNAQLYTCLTRILHDDSCPALLSTHDSHQRIRPGTDIFFFSDTK